MITTITRRIVSDYRLKPMTETLFFINIITCLASCDIVYEFVAFWQYLSVISLKTFGILNSGYPHGWCVVKALCIQFPLLLSISYNFILGLILFEILYFKVGLIDINKRIVFYHIGVWIFAFILATIPLIFNAYGYVNNPNGKEFECWVENGSFQLCLYGPVALEMIIFIILLLYYGYIRYYSKYDRIANLNKQIVYFTCVFVCVWIFPLADRIISMGDNAAPDIIVWLHDIGFASFGFFNAVIWLTSDLLKNYQKNIQQMNMNHSSSELTMVLRSASSSSINMPNTRSGSPSLSSSKSDTDNDC